MRDICVLTLQELPHSLENCHKVLKIYQDDFKALIDEYTYVYIDCMQAVSSWAWPDYRVCPPPPFQWFKTICDQDIFKLQI